MTSVATDKAAAALGRSSGGLRWASEIEPLTDTWPELDEKTAYAIQKRLVIGQVKDESSRISGLKLGLTSVAKQKQMSVGEPIYGLLIASRMVDEGEPLADRVADSSEGRARDRDRHRHEICKVRE